MKIPYLLKQLCQVLANQIKMFISVKAPPLHSQTEASIKQKQVLNRSASKKYVINISASVILRVISLLCIKIRL